MKSQQARRADGPKTLLPADRGFWDMELRARIGKDLRSIFEGTLKEPLPPHLDELLAKIEGGAQSSIMETREARSARPRQ